ncbi:hypothetical protein [Metabacillus sp. Hm71]|uniref:hypothetical protein n=1 Tax=Metabacillus sp. Hm71 TaxID=3450743 RepID=UPI003F43E6B9
MRIGSIIAHLINNEDEKIAVLTSQASLLNVDEIESKTIKQVLLFDPKSFMEGIEEDAETD